MWYVQRIRTQIVFGLHAYPALLAVHGECHLPRPIKT
jgi:hypothetical protein